MSAIDAPFDEIVAKVEAILEAGNVSIWQKFSCAHCGVRQTMDEPNVLYRSGRCEECGLITDIEAQGCGFSLIASDNPKIHEIAAKSVKGEPIE